MKINDRLWLLLNRKEPSKWLYYLTVFFSGFATAVVLTIGIVVLTSNTAAGLAILGCALISVIWSFTDDNRRGYIKVIHARHVELWKERRKRLGIK